MTTRTWTVGSITIAGVLGAFLALSSAMQTGSTSFCQRCGDGFCAPSCENAQTCPIDCAPVER